MYSSDAVINLKPNSPSKLHTVAFGGCSIAAPEHICMMLCLSCLCSPFMQHGLVVKPGLNGTFLYSFWEPETGERSSTLCSGILRLEGAAPRPARSRFFFLTRHKRGSLCTDMISPPVLKLGISQLVQTESRMVPLSCK
jgi:hypothetical protein